ncbi:MAG: trigger factor [Nitrospirae bacterium]|nr:trigger factor [Nitrospirota bacterium]
MNSLVEDISAARKRITIEATAAEVEGEIQKSLNQVRSRSRLPGFRPGKAPMSLIEKRYRKDVETEVLDRLIPDYYADTIKTKGLNPLTAPILESKDYQSKGDLKIVCYVEVRPEVEGLVYEDLPITSISTEVNDEEVERQIKALAANKTTYIPVDRAIQVDDLIIADIKDVQDGKVYTDQYFKVGSESLSEDFSNALIGKNKSDVVEANTALPDYFPTREIAGKTVQLKVTIKDIKELSVPVVDDELAKDVGVENLEELRTKVKETLEKFNKDRAVKTQKAEIVKAMVDKYDFELPEIALQAELDSIVQQAKTQNSYKELSDDELRQRFKDDAVRSLKAKVILDTIGEKEEVTVSDEELQMRLKDIAYASSMTPEVLKQLYESMQDSLEVLRYTMYREKIVDIIFSKAKIVEGGQ